MKRLVLALCFSFCGLLGMGTTVPEEAELNTAIDTLLAKMDSNGVAYTGEILRLYSRTTFEYPPTRLALIETFKEECIKNIDSVGRMVLLSGTVTESIHKQLIRIIVNTILGE